MPDMTGVNFLENAKKEFPNIVTIIVTGQRELDMIADAQREGKIFSFHDKPWDLEYLEKMILSAYEEYCVNLKK
jgi:DNA-binding NtrC family response regulator